MLQNGPSCLRPEITSRSGSLDGDDDDRDYYTFTLHDPREMSFRPTGLTENADLYLEGANGRVLKRSRKSSVSDEFITIALDAGTYYVRVESKDSEPVNYQLEVLRDAGGSPATAIDLGDVSGTTVSASRSGTVNTTDDQRDYYRFTLSGQRAMQMELTGLSGWAALVLEDDSGEQLRLPDETGTQDELIAIALDPGTYYLRVEAQGSGRLPTSSAMVRRSWRRAAYRQRGSRR